MSSRAIFKSKWFNRWAHKHNITDNQLHLAVVEIENGIVNAKLTKYLVKKRIPTNNKGKRGSYRTIIAISSNDDYYYVYGFAKNMMSNVSKKELAALNLLAIQFENYTPNEIVKACQQGELIKVKHNGKKNT